MLEEVVAVVAELMVVVMVVVTVMGGQGSHVTIVVIWFTSQETFGQLVVAHIK